MGRVISIQTVMGCNQACYFCRSRSGTADLLPAPEVMRRLEEGRAEGADVIRFTGGEPLLDRRIRRFVKMAASFGYSHIEIETNGTISSLKGVAAPLVKAGLTKVWGAVMDSDDAKNDALTRDPGGAQRSWKGFQAFASEGVELGLSIAVLPENVMGLSALIDRAVEEVSLLVAVRFYIVTDLRTPKPYGELEKGLAKACARARKHKLDFRFQPAFAPPPCSFSDRFIELYSPLFSGYSVTDRGVEGARERISTCSACDLADRCPGMRPEYIKGCSGALPSVPPGEKAIESLKTQLGGVYANRASQMQVIALVDKDGSSRFEKPNIRVNWACNERCRFCWVDFNWAPPTREKVFEQVDAVAKQGHKWVALTGGEPTLVPWLPEVIQRAREAGVDMIELQSNAVHLADLDYVGRLVDAGLNYAHISFHSYDAEISDAITQTPGAWAKSLVGIDNLVNGGIRVSLSHVLTGWNLEQSTEFVDFVADRWQGQVAITWSVAAPITAASTRYEDGVLPFDDVKPFLLAGLIRCEERGVKFGGQSETCGVPPCVLDDNRRWVKTVPSEMAELPGFTKPESCNTCSYFNGCRGVRNTYVERFGDRGLSPISPSESTNEPAESLNSIG